MPLGASRYYYYFENCPSLIYFTESDGSDDKIFDSRSSKERLSIDHLSYEANYAILEVIPGAELLVR